MATWDSLTDYERQVLGGLSKKDDRTLPEIQEAIAPGSTLSGSGLQTVLDRMVVQGRAVRVSRPGAAMGVAYRILTSTERAKCHECHRTRPEAQTTLIFAYVGGDYRRAKRRGKIRVCVDCTIRRVEYVRGATEKGLRDSVSNGRISWASAAERFGIDISDLKERP